MKMKRGVYPRCRNKVLEESRAKRARVARTEKVNAYHREYNRRYKYGLKRGQIEAMLLAAGEQCELCAKPLTLQTARVDHDHACCTGLKGCGKCVRGILCNRCNVALGLFGDDPTRLAEAIAYLEDRSVATRGAA